MVSPSRDMKTGWTFHPVSMPLNPFCCQAGEAPNLIQRVFRLSGNPIATLRAQSRASGVVPCAPQIALRIAAVPSENPFRVSHRTNGDRNSHHNPVTIRGCGGEGLRDLHGCARSLSQVVHYAPPCHRWLPLTVATVLPLPGISGFGSSLWLAH